MSYKDRVNRFSATPVGSWLGRNIAARIDPIIYKLSRGRFTSTGPPSLPQLVLTTTGRKSGKPRDVQLAYTPDGDDYIVVASNWGQEHHPAWMYNLEANPEATVQIDGDARRVVAHRLDDVEKEKLWDRLVEHVPQYATYIDRTDRNLRVFRLKPA